VTKYVGLILEIIISSPLFFQKIMTYLFDFPHGPKVSVVFIYHTGTLAYQWYFVLFICLRSPMKTIHISHIIYVASCIV